MGGLGCPFWIGEFKKESSFAKKIAKKLDDITLTIKVKAGENGKIFGGVTSKEISEELKKQYKIEKIKTTVPYDNVERAARTTADASNMIAKVLERLGNSYEMFKFAAKKQLIGNAADKAVTAGLVTTIAIPTNTATGEAFIKQVKEDVETASFPNEGGLNKSLIGAAPSLVLYVKKGVMPSLEVDTLAAVDEADETVKAFDLLLGETYFCGFTGVPFVPEKHS